MQDSTDNGGKNTCCIELVGAWMTDEDLTLVMCVSVSIRRKQQKEEQSGRSQHPDTEPLSVYVG